MILIASMLASANAHAPNWRCSCPGFIQPSERVTVEFRRTLHALVDDFGIAYSIRSALLPQKGQHTHQGQGLW